MKIMKKEGESGVLDIRFSAAISRDIEPNQIVKSKCQVLLVPN